MSAALPRHLHRRGHDVLLVVPFYRHVRESGRAFEEVEELSDLSVAIGPHDLRFSVLRAPLPGTEMPVHFVRCDGLYDRESIYTEDPDEHLRFVLLCYAALGICQHLEFSPDVVHANDWQGALLPLILRTRFAWDTERFGAAKTVLTVHNLAHQGGFPASTLPDTGLADSAHLFHQEQLRAGVISFLLTGILYADAITVVSPTYAREIQSPELGMGLDGFLRERSSTVVGILNGIDPIEWDPETDTLIPKRYSAATLDDKAVNKEHLMKSLGLPYGPRTPVLGVVSRLTWQKGLELILEALPRFLRRRQVQLVVLGSGTSEYENSFASMQHYFPDYVRFYRGFSNELAHLIEAGADMFLMPSRFEPCGLNQMYSLGYGTVPIVRKTGGLADSVEHFDPSTGRGTGFVFEHLDARGLSWAIDEALRVWPNAELWRTLQRNGMAADFSWERQVTIYEELYRRLLEMG